MDHVAIDLGGRESQVCVRGSDGGILEEKRMPTRSLAQWLSERATSRVIMETCSESFEIADRAIGRGHDVRIVPSTLVKSLGVGARRTKSDRRDAQVLSEASCRIELPSVHIPSPAARKRKLLCGTRDALVTSRTQLINCVRGWLRLSAQSLSKGYPVTFPRRVRDKVGAGIPACIERLLVSIETLSAQILAADKDLDQEAGSDTVCTRLMTVPGVGPVTALRFVATVDRIDRFETAHALQSYLGLVPGEHSSGDRTRRLGITKAGATATRVALIQAAWSVRRYRKDHPMTRWATQIEDRRGKHIAAVALARKIAGILYAIWRDGTTYSPFRGARTA
jgi:transposase